MGLAPPPHGGAGPELSRAGLKLDNCPKNDLQIIDLKKKEHLTTAKKKAPFLAIFFSGWTQQIGAGRLNWPGLAGSTQLRKYYCWDVPNSGWLQQHPPGSAQP